MLLVESELLSLGAIVMVLMAFVVVALLMPYRQDGELSKPFSLSEEQRQFLQTVVADENKRRSALNKSRRRAARLEQAARCFGREC